MSRGLSRQQRHILAMLETKHDPRDNSRGWFSTQEVVMELYPEYRLWLFEVDGNPWFRSRREHIDYTKWDKRRLSVYRALRSLERRGKIVSFLRGADQARYWAVPERLDERRKKWVKTEEERFLRSEPWRIGAQIRAFLPTLPLDLQMPYRLRIVNSEEMERIRWLWDLWKQEHPG